MVAVAAANESYRRQQPYKSTPVTIIGDAWLMFGGDSSDISDGAITLPRWLITEHQQDLQATTLTTATLCSECVIAAVVFVFVCVLRQQQSI